MLKIIVKIGLLEPLTMQLEEGFGVEFIGVQAIGLLPDLLELIAAALRGIVC